MDQLRQIPRPGQEGGFTVYFARGATGVSQRGGEQACELRPPYHDQFPTVRTFEPNLEIRSDQ